MIEDGQRFGATLAPDLFPLRQQTGEVAKQTFSTQWGL